jgi:hypothetical protein
MINGKSMKQVIQDANLTPEELFTAYPLLCKIEDLIQKEFYQVEKLVVQDIVKHVGKQAFIERFGIQVFDQYSSCQSD